MAEISIERPQLRLVALMQKQILAHMHEVGCAARCLIEPADHLLSAWLCRLVQAQRIQFARVLAISVYRAFQCRAVGAKFMGELQKEIAPPFSIELRIAGQHIFGERNT